MSSAQEHYDDLLAEHYTWMLGDDIEQTARAQRALLEQLGIRPGAHAGGSTAVDVGCGSGAQTLALADMGFDTVLAVDSNEALLAELAGHAARRPAVRTVHGDAVDALAELAPGGVDVVACMGDTLLHLPPPSLLVERAEFSGGSAQ